MPRHPERQPPKLNNGSSRTREAPQPAHGSADAWIDVYDVNLRDLKAHDCECCKNYRRPATLQTFSLFMSDLVNADSSALGRFGQLARVGESS